MNSKWDPDGCTLKRWHKLVTFSRFVACLPTFIHREIPHTCCWAVLNSTGVAYHYWRLHWTQTRFQCLLWTVPFFDCLNELSSANMDFKGIRCGLFMVFKWNPVISHFNSQPLLELMEFLCLQVNNSETIHEYTDILPSFILPYIYVL